MTIRGAVSFYESNIVMKNTQFLNNRAILDVGIPNEVLLLETVFKTSFLGEISKVFLVFELLFFG